MESHSVQRRIAAQKGLPAPDFSKTDASCCMQARIEERRKIGKWLEKQNWNPDYHGAYVIPHLVMKRLIEDLKHGELPEGA